MVITIIIFTEVIIIEMIARKVMLFISFIKSMIKITIIIIIIIIIIITIAIINFITIVIVNFIITIVTIFKVTTLAMLITVITNVQNSIFSFFG